MKRRRQEGTPALCQLSPGTKNQLYLYSALFVFINYLQVWAIAMSWVTEKRQECNKGGRVLLAHAPDKEKRGRELDCLPRKADMYAKLQACGTQQAIPVQLQVPAGHSLGTSTPHAENSLAWVTACASFLLLDQISIPLPLCSKVSCLPSWKRCRVMEA